MREMDLVVNPSSVVVGEWITSWIFGWEGWGQWGVRGVDAIFEGGGERVDSWFERRRRLMREEEKAEVCE